MRFGEMFAFRLSFAFVAAVVGGPAGGVASAQESLAGEWVGVIGDDLDAPDAMILTLLVPENSQEATFGWYAPPRVGLDMRAGESPVSLSRTPEGSVRFSSAIDGREVSFAGRLHNAHEIDGLAIFDEGELAFRLDRLATMRADYETAHLGAFRFESGRTFAVTWHEHGHLRLVEIGDPSGGVMEGLYPISQSAFSPRSEIARPDGPSQWWVFTRGRDQTINGVTWRKPDGTTERAERIDLFRQEKVDIPSDGVTLAATLLTPLTEGPHTGVVLVHGGEVTHRSELFPEAARLVQKGLAVLLYDLRGHAASGGHTTPTPDEIAADALAAVAFLQAHEGISAAQSGLMLARQTRADETD